ncbi:hypothetical protein BJ742DRAFT_821620 [Cladochytrium replicatum]|nr:hypothetical protein BJ742DRAFT_821620 [Cladochytrium replicatum]
MYTMLFFNFRFSCDFFVLVVVCFFGGMCYPFSLFFHFNSSHGLSLSSLSFSKFFIVSPSYYRWTPVLVPLVTFALNLFYRVLSFSHPVFSGRSCFCSRHMCFLLYSANFLDREPKCFFHITFVLFPSVADKDMFFGIPPSFLNTPLPTPPLSFFFFTSFIGGPCGTIHLKIQMKNTS